MESNDAEKWKPYPHNDNYNYSNRGRFMRVKGGQQGARVGRILKPCLETKGYLFISVSKNGETQHVRIGTAVWEYHHGKIPLGKELNHENLIKTDDRIENLEIVTHLENMQHYNNSPQGKEKKFNGGGRAKLTPQDILNIYLLLKKGTQVFKIAEKYNVTQPTISAINRGITWTHIPPKQIYPIYIYKRKLDIKIIKKYALRRSVALVKKKITRVELATKTGNKYITVCKWIDGYCLPPIEFRKYFAKKLNKTVGYFFKERG